MVQAPKSGQNQGQSGVFLWSANYTPSGPQINRPGFLHQPSLGVTRTANENHHLVKMERPHLMDGGHGYYLPYHAGEEHIETSVWFPVVQLDVNGHKASALLDICSTGCYIDSNFARKLGLEPVTDSCNIETLSGASSCTNKYDFSFSKDENSYKIQCYGVNNIPVPCPNIDIKSFKHLRNLPLEVIRTGSVDLLLGSNLGDILKPLEVRYSERKNEPYAIRTALGWCVCGTTGSSFSKIKSKNFVYVTNKQQDNPTLTDFKALWNVDQDIGQDIYESADENKCLPASKFMADQRLKSLVKRLNKHGLYQIYNEEVETLLNKGFAEHVVEKTIPQAVWYIPHHFVPKKGNKIRIVYDCAAQVEGRSINTEVLQGPDLNNTLLGVLLRFRLYPFAAMGDIEAMYMQVKVPPSQRDLIRFLWCNSDGSNIKSYRMTSHIFGGVWSPAAALFALQHCATFSNDKRVKGIILKSFYVDDMLASFQSLQKMKTVVNNVVEHLGGFGFNLRDILFNVSEVDRQSKISFHGALGLKWHNSVDMLSIVEITKRSILSTVAGVFDPLGLTSPGRWNCRGYRSKYDEICRLLNDHNPTAMCLQETRLNDTCNTTIRRYSIYRRDLPSEHPAGGVCIIVNNQIPHSSVQLNSSLQAIAVRVSMHKVLTICSIYIPPSSPIIAADLQDLLRQLPAPALICGDFNGHNLLWGSRVTNPRGRTIENIILHNNLCLFNDTSMTYLDLSAGTYSALDLTICHPSLFQDFTWMVDGDLHTSDHFPIHVKGNGPPVKGRPQRWKLHKADWTVFKQLCAEQLNISSFAEISDQYSEFINILLEVAEISIPKTSQYPKRFNKPWFNKDCKDAVRERKRLLRKFSLRPTSDNLSSYRQAAAAARRTIRQAKRESWRQYVSKLNSQSSIKSAWDRLRKIRGKGTSDAYKHLNVGGTAITSQLGIANALGQSFCRNSSSDNCTGSFRSYKNRAESHQLDFKTTNTEVYNQVFSLEELRRSLRASKDTSPGPDSIHYQMLKHLPDCSLALMLNIFNTIWITGAIPSSWLEATVIPIPKPGKDHTDPSNYRPIALTSCICKTMERMINCRLTYFLETNNILTKYQSGFRRHRSTIDHLVKFETLVREAFVRREHLVAVFFDLEKAYETTWKYGILRDLFNSGLRGRMPIFINHFLTNRKFRVRVGTTFSDRFDLEMGVPQGSILSVTHFSLKINDIVNHVKSGTQCFLYVDDLVVAYASKSISTIERHLQLSLNKIEKWTNENGFKFSSSKTVSMHYCLLTRPHHDPQLRLGSSPIPLVNSTRFLGLIFDKKLNFLKHMQVLKSKCLRALNLLRILSNTNWGADRKVMLRFYRSLIRSKLDYGSVVYGSARKSYLRVLDPVHNQGLRLSLGAFRTTPAESLYVEAYEPSLYLRREKLSLQYACRLRANPENPCYDVTFHPNHRETFARRQNSIPTFGLRVLPLFEQIGLPLGNIAKCVLPSIPPWTMNRPIINFSLTGLKKGTTPSYVYLNKFLEVSDSYHGYHHIYTDGSRQNDEVAAAAISSLRSLSSRLPDKSSIFSAESKALLLALDIVENSTYGRYIILSDSLSCLMALDNMKYSHPTICEILFKLHNLSFSNHVIFCWIPSHVGISGNEKADFAAKSALSLPVDHQFISYHDFYMYILKHILSIWQSKWDGEINNKLHAIKPKLGEWALAYRKSRKEESILCRLRVGHTYLTHSFLLRNEAQPVCGRCQLPLTVRHVLVDCAALTSVRSRFYSPPPWEEFFQELDIVSDPTDLEVKHTAHLIAPVEDSFSELVERISSYTRLRRIVGYILRFSKCCKKLKPGTTVEILQLADHVILRQAQISIDPTKLKSLDLILENELYRVGGRISKTYLPSKQIYVPDGAVAKLLVLQAHQLMGHMGVNSTLSELRQRYWISRSIVKSVVYNCSKCKILKGTTSTQKMSNIPEERLGYQQSAFYYTGLDIFGPFMITRKRSSCKAWGLLLTCMTTRAIHLEKLEGLDTSSFLNGLERFFSRRGLPKKITCDNAPNFKRGQKELQAELHKLNSEGLTQKLANANIEFSYIPPYSSHFGGVYERQIRTVRQVLQSMLFDQQFKVIDDVMNTFFCQVEAIVNTKPISPLHNRSNDEPALRPIDFIVPKCSIASLPIDASTVNCYTKAWKRVHAMLDCFWRRWLRSYLPLLQQRSKWWQKTNNQKIGDIVLVVDPNAARADWKLGKVTAVKFSEDGLVRSVEVLCHGKIITRPITKLVNLEIV
ncbi:RNA-directed DNA polymerase from mobile element jockey [Nymphon striatum]|nr:RNA-directed DNA polymerase from mobile element jockey [Nymphon striatum]